MISLLRKSISSPRFRQMGKIVEGFTRRRQELFSTRSLSSSSSQPVVELREDLLLPQHSKAYFDRFRDPLDEIATNTDHSRLCFVSRSELGGPLHAATHAYYFSGGLSELQEQRSKEDTTFENTNDLHAYIHSQQSSVYVEAPLVKEYSDLVVGLDNITVRPGDEIKNNYSVLEIRRYNLKLGYDTVPKFLEIFGAGLPSKLKTQDSTTSLMTLLYSEVGRLNEVIEIWSHGEGVPAMERSRVAARKAQEWRGAIASIADLAIEFRSTIHRPILAPCHVPK